MPWCTQSGCTAKSVMKLTAGTRRSRCGGAAQAERREGIGRYDDVRIEPPHPTIDAAAGQAGDHPGDRRAQPWREIPETVDRS